jgi:hypothetical protein
MRWWVRKALSLFNLMLLSAALFILSASKAPAPYATVKSFRPWPANCSFVVNVASPLFVFVKEGKCTRFSRAEGVPRAETHHRLQHSDACPYQLRRKTLNNCHGSGRGIPIKWCTICASVIVLLMESSNTDPRIHKVSANTDSKIAHRRAQAQRFDDLPRSTEPPS